MHIDKDLFLSRVEFNDTPTRYRRQNCRNYYRKESYVPVLLERVRDCFPNCLRVAMEGTSESRYHPKEYRIRGLRARPPMLPSLSAFGNATSSHRNSPQHRQKFVVQRNEFVCSSITHSHGSVRVF